MKKTYIIPEMETIKLESVQLLDASPSVGLGEGDIDGSNAGSRELENLLDW